MAFYTNIFLFYCSAQVILAFNIYYALAFNSSNIKGSLPEPSIISRILSQLLVPVLRSISENNLKTSYLNAPIVHKAIQAKIEELQPLLQDNDETADEEKLMLEDKEDTTIIEFLPKTDERNKKIESDKSHLKKYKKIREKISKALKKESVSEKTNNLVVKTLDGLIKTLLSSQCKWKRNLRAVKFEKPSEIANKLNSGFQSIKELILSFVKNNTTRRNDDVMNFLDTIETMFRSVTDDIDSVTKKYRILCDFVPKEHNNYAVNEEIHANALRNNWDKTDLEEDRCRNVVVCSNELEEFMIHFYHTLNDTAVSVLKNYVEMYTRDVNADNDSEKHVIIDLLNKVTTDLEKDTTKEFVSETQKLWLDETKNKQANVKAMSQYVTNTIKNVKKLSNQMIKTELHVLREKVSATILDDLNVNLDVDLGNLEQEFIKKICAMFVLCNGIYRGRRQGSNTLNKNKLFVQVQLTLDNDMTNIKTVRKFLGLATTKNSSYNRFEKPLTNVSVTRTTLIDYVTNNII